ncbi:MAG TPA: acetolactate synthase large subunit [Streptosporangiaceae bacterium]|nr:acetolactate synthase large subunit [Streptosporangiaceae bacterium]
MTTLTGAEAIVQAAVAHGAEICFANPGTTEMPLVAALDTVPGVRAVLGLQENVCTGAADGYARIAGKAALTLLHLGPGLANGLANLHNARRAHTPVVNVVGDHASWHLRYDAPLTSDIAALAGTVGTVYPVTGRAEAAAAMRAAFAGRCVSTVVVPADFQRAVAPEIYPERRVPPVPGPSHVPEAQVETAAAALRQAGTHAVLILGGNGLGRAGQAAAGRIAAATGARLYSETFPARAERGGGLPAIGRLPYFPETATAALQDASVVITAGAAEPVAYFGYDGMPSVLAPPGTVRRLAGPAEDAERALEALAEMVADAGPAGPAGARPASAEAPPPGTPLSGEVAGAVLAAALPEHAIVSVEGGTCGYPFYDAAAGAPRHTVLTNTGGAIGQGLPVALGAAIAAPDRPVIALQSDGSGLYTPQALWTMGRERCDIVVLIAANRAYQVLRTELARHGAVQPGTGRPGPQAAGLTSLDGPRIDWVALAGGFGVAAARVATAGELGQAIKHGVAEGGPHLVEMTL